MGFKSDEFLSSSGGAEYWRAGIYALDGMDLSASLGAVQDRQNNEALRFGPVYDDIRSARNDQFPGRDFSSHVAKMGVAN